MKELGYPLGEEEFQSWTATTMTDPGGILLGSLGLQFLKRLTPYFKNQCIKF